MDHLLHGYYTRAYLDVHLSGGSPREQRTTRGLPLPVFLAAASEVFIFRFSGDSTKGLHGIPLNMVAKVSPAKKLAHSVLISV
jgi:hypothetical protein